MTVPAPVTEDGVPPSSSPRVQAAYQEFFGLHAAPFSIAVDPHYLYLSDQHREALAHLLYGVAGSNGFVLLTGEVGTGKTTLTRCLLDQLPESTDLALVLNPGLQPEALLAAVCEALAVSLPKSVVDMKSLSDALHRHLRANYQRGRRTVVLIDEAQLLSVDALEQLRLLTNLETESEKLLQIILVGQPELEQTLSRPELRQFSQRIVARFHLGRLGARQVADYVQHRLLTAGMPALGVLPFTPAALRSLHRSSQGLPRLINVIADRALAGAYARGVRQVDRALLRRAAAEVLGSRRRRTPWLIPLVLASGAALAAGVFNLVAPLLTGTSAVGNESSTVPAQAGEASAHWQWSDEGAVMDRLWQWSAGTPAGARQDCPPLGQERIACVRARASGWNELRELDRPVVLELLNPQRRPRYALLVGLAPPWFELATPEGVEMLHAESVLTVWTGAYRLLWMPPRGFRTPVSLRNDSQAARDIARWFAELDDQGEALPVEPGLLLQQRVRLFQREQGLDDDGIAGMQTLLRLSGLLGRERRLRRSTDVEG